MVDLDGKRGTLANAVAPALGTASGAVLSGVLVHWLPQPTQLVYWVLGTVYLLQAAGVALMSETGLRKPGALASLRPRFGASPQARTALALRRSSEKGLLAFGATALLLGMAGMLLGLQVASPAVYIASSMAAGAGFGASFQGGVRSGLAASARRGVERLPIA